MRVGSNFLRSCPVAERLAGRVVSIARLAIIAACAGALAAAEGLTWGAG